MTLHRLKNNDERSSKIRLSNEPYLVINLLLAGIIILIFVYSAVFSPYKDNYPVTCMHEVITGRPCASCGLSHSFSLIIRGQFRNASEWNVYGMRVFIFFASQLLLRIVFSFYYLKNPQNRGTLILTDITGSAIMFILAFLPFMRWIADVLVAQ